MENNQEREQRAPQLEHGSSGEQTRHRNYFVILLFVLLAAFVLVPVIYEVTQDKTEANRKRANLIAMMEELNRLDLENEQYRRYLDGENFDEYLERHARDEWGYADPHERIYRAN